MMNLNNLTMYDPSTYSIYKLDSRIKGVESRYQIEQGVFSHLYIIYINNDDSPRNDHYNDSISEVMDIIYSYISYARESDIDVYRETGERTGMLFDSNLMLDIYRGGGWTLRSGKVSNCTLAIRRFINPTLKGIRYDTGLVSEWDQNSITSLKQLREHIIRGIESIDCYPFLSGLNDIDIKHDHNNNTDIFNINIGDESYNIILISNVKGGFIDVMAPDSFIYIISNYMNVNPCGECRAVRYSYIK